VSAGEDYGAALALLGRLTPLPADCGALCGGLCCRGGPGDGMLLFPGEAEALKNIPFLRFRRREMGGLPVTMAVCRGRCVRARRPLACRIYPLAPRLRDGVLSVAPDPRARNRCPLLDPTAGDPIDPAFADAVLAAFARLRTAPGAEAFLRAYTAVLEDYEKFLPGETDVVQGQKEREPGENAKEKEL
jgi:hypothetical protein